MERGRWQRTHAPTCPLPASFARAPPPQAGEGRRGKMPQRRALIIGGSLGGLIAAHLLRSVGWDAVVFERNAVDLPSRGAGIGTHSHLIDVLRRAGIPFDDSMGVKVGSVICLERDGAVVLRKSTARLMSGWARLYRSLRAPLPPDCYRLRRAVPGVGQGREG